MMVGLWRMAGSLRQVVGSGSPSGVDFWDWRARSRSGRRRRCGWGSTTARRTRSQPLSSGGLSGHRVRPTSLSIFTYIAAKGCWNPCSHMGAGCPPPVREDGALVEATVESFDASRGARLAAYSAVSTSLALCSDRELRDLVDTATPMGSGIGGTSALLEVGGTPVFVKRLPLTDWKGSRRTSNPRQTSSGYRPSAIPALGFPEAQDGGPGGSWPCTP
jgi:hypothetical protein